MPIPSPGLLLGQLPPFYLPWLHLWKPFFKTAICVLQYVPSNWSNTLSSSILGGIFLGILLKNAVQMNFIGNLQSTGSLFSYYSKDEQKVIG